MTISTQYTPEQYTCDGSQTVFAYGWKIFVKTEITVYIQHITSGVKTTLTVDTDYTVSGVGNETGGDVTTVATYSSDYYFVIESNAPYTQAADFEQNDSFHAKTVENALDKLEIQVQQVKDSITRSIQYSITETANLTFPPTESTKKYIAGDSTNGLYWDDVTVTTTSYGATFSTDTYANIPVTPGFGDIFYANDTGNLYGCKSAGSWTLMSRIDINALTEKTTLADNDIFVIEDSAASNAKKKVKFSNLNDGKIKVDSGDTAEYLEDKIDDDTIKLDASDNLKVADSITNFINTNKVSSLAEPNCNLGYAMYIMADGTVRSVGNNVSWNLGCGEIATDRVLPVSSFALATVSKVYYAYNSAYILTTAGDVYSCGGNSFGQLGLGDTTARGFFEKVSISGVSKLAVTGGYHSNGVTIFALKTNGDVYCWGYNGQGVLGQGDTTNRTSPVQVSGSWSDVACTTYAPHALLLNSSGEVYSCGYNVSGQLGQGGTADLSTFTQIATLSSISKIYAYGYNSYFINSSGQLYSCGENGNYECADGTTTDVLTPTAISGMTTVDSVFGAFTHIGGSRGCIMNDGTIRTWGYNGYGECSNGATTQITTPYNPGLSGITKAFFYGSWAIAPAYYISLCALKSDGTVYVCGYNGNGQLGTGNVTSISTAVAISTIDTSKVSDISCCGSSSIGNLQILMTDGTVLTCGDNTQGQCGIGSISNIYGFTKVIF